MPDTPPVLSLNLVVGGTVVPPSWGVLHVNHKLECCMELAWSGSGGAAVLMLKCTKEQRLVFVCERLCLGLGK